MKRIFLTIIALFFSQIVCFSEEIHFDNEVYTLKYSSLAPKTNGYGNEYFRGNENVSQWSKMIGVYYFPEEDNPLKFAENFDKTIENTDNSVLLKLIENKRCGKAAISFLVNGCENSKKFFEYDIYRFEKHPQKGMVMMRYSVKNYFKNDDEIKSIAKRIKDNNDKYLENIIVSPMPSIVEKDVSLTN